MRRVVVVGGSLAGHRVAESLRVLGFEGDVTVIGEEVHRPYDRWPLSEGYLVGETARAELDISSRHDEHVGWRLGESATGLDLSSRRVLLRDGGAVAFDGLVVATGARARRLSSTDHVRDTFALRTIEDADCLKEALSSRPREIAVVGGGLIGAEVASVAVALGHRVTLITPGTVPAPRQLGRLVSAHVDRARLSSGVRVLRRCRVRGVARKAGQTAGVLLQNGRWLPADVVVMAMGTVPNVEWLRGSGLQVSDGLLCGPTLHAVGSSVVVGAGDVVRAPQPLLDHEPVRMEHWASTHDQASLAASSLLAGPLEAGRLSALPRFGTILHGLDIRVVGYPAAADHDDIVSGSLEAGPAVVSLTRRGKVVGAVSVDRAVTPDELARFVHGARSRA